MCKIDSQREFAVWLRKLKQRLCINLEWWDGREMGWRFKREGIYVYLWVICVEVCQKTAKFCKAIIFQLNFFNFLKKEPQFDWFSFKVNLCPRALLQ